MGKISEEKRILQKCQEKSARHAEKKGQQPLL